MDAEQVRMSGGPLDGMIFVIESWRDEVRVDLREHAGGGQGYIATYRRGARVGSRLTSFEYVPEPEPAGVRSEPEPVEAREA